MRAPSCPSRSTLTTVKSRAWLFVVALVAVLAVVPCGAGAAAKKKHRLQAFGSCSRFVHYARRHALKELTTRGTPVAAPLPVTRAPQPNNQVTVQGESAPGAPTAGDDFSTTNVQESGVDEPDQVKTDGKRIFVAQNGRLYALDARSEPPKLLGSIDLQGSNQQLLLAGDKLLVLAGSPIVYGIELVE